MIWLAQGGAALGADPAAGTSAATPAAPSAAAPAAPSAAAAAAASASPGVARGGPAAAADPWPLQLVDRPATAPGGTRSLAFTSVTILAPDGRSRSYIGFATSWSLHDRVELDAGVPHVVCVDYEVGACDGSFNLDHAWLGGAVGLHRNAVSDVTAGVAGSFEHYQPPAEYRGAVWLMARRTYLHRLAFIGRGDLGAGWHHDSVVGAGGALVETNQTRVSWMEQLAWQISARATLWTFARSYRPIGVAGDSSWATAVGGGGAWTLDRASRLELWCNVDNVMPVRAWQYEPDGKTCSVTYTLYRLPRGAAPPTLPLAGN
jgi:hypothetical protein